MDNPPVVFIVHESAHDYTPAENFGEVVFITGLDLSPVMASPRNARLFNDIRTAMRRYRPGVDYILSSGNPAINALLMLSIGMKFGEVEHNFLRWDRMARTYVLHKITPLENAA